MIGQLSRGFRQRVGLAEAMVHDPEILILDEPTSGLDPLQIREVRDLIRELGERHTILLSTHILSEVEAVCGRVIIIANGRIAVDDQLANLKRQTAITLEARGPTEPIQAALQTIPGVERVAVRATAGEISPRSRSTPAANPTCARRSARSWCPTAGRCGSSTCGAARSRSGSPRS